MEPPAQLEIPDRFWRKIVQQNTCWVWTAATNSPTGYGVFRYNKRNYVAHRFLYEKLVEQVPADLDLDHLCRNRRCVNPAHLEPVTRAENLRRGIGPAVSAARQRAITHCVQGHEYDTINTAYKKNGWRVCKACARIRSAKNRAKRE